MFFESIENGEQSQKYLLVLQKEWFGVRLDNLDRDSIHFQRVHDEFPYCSSDRMHQLNRVAINFFLFSHQFVQINEDCLQYFESVILFVLNNDSVQDSEQLHVR